MTTVALLFVRGEFRAVKVGLDAYVIEHRTDRDALGVDIWQRVANVADGHLFEIMRELDARGVRLDHMPALGSPLHTLHVALEAGQTRISRGGPASWCASAREEIGKALLAVTEAAMAIGADLEKIEIAEKAAAKAQTEATS